MIAGAVAADEDPRTLGLWSRAAGVSTRTLQYACAAAHVSPAACRDLARVLRLVVATLAGGEAWDPFAQLNADPRTIRRLMERAGLSEERPPGDLVSFIARQRIVRRPPILSVLQSTCSRWSAPVEAPRAGPPG